LSNFLLPVFKIKEETPARSSSWLINMFYLHIIGSVDRPSGSGSDHKAILLALLKIENWRIFR
jgi:hypothetical protein